MPTHRSDALWVGRGSEENRKEAEKLTVWFTWHRSGQDMLRCIWTGGNTHFLVKTFTQAWSEEG